jgi:hypothetical protein
VWARQCCTTGNALRVLYAELRMSVFKDFVEWSWIRMCVLFHLLFLLFDVLMSVFFNMVGAVLKRKSPMSFDDEDPILKKRLHNALAGLGQW